MSERELGARGYSRRTGHVQFKQKMRARKTHATKKKKKKVRVLSVHVCRDRERNLFFYSFLQIRNHAIRETPAGGFFFLLFCPWGYRNIYVTSDNRSSNTFLLKYLTIIVVFTHE